MTLESQCDGNVTDRPTIVHTADQSRAVTIRRASYPNVWCIVTATDDQPTLQESQALRPWSAGRSANQIVFAQLPQPYSPPPMTPASLNAATGKETELKLALPTRDPAGLARQLASTPALKRRKPIQQRLQSVYFDTPEQELRRQEVALRIRRIDGSGDPQWLQTLKTGHRCQSALSRRGEWETKVTGPALERDALDRAAWSRIDPRGNVFSALAPLFVTDFTRTLWMVRRRDGSVVEVALDIGFVAVGEHTTPICELELELKAGPVTALFDIALQIAASVPVFPLAMNKAQHGFALASGAVDAPVKASPPRITGNMSLNDCLRSVMGEMFGQFCANLNPLRHSDDPKVGHQTRVAWRRFKSARGLFKPMLARSDVPDLQALAPFLALLGELRDLEVLLGQTLPPLRDDYVAHDDTRANTWIATLQRLSRAAEVQRSAVRDALEDPAVGVCLLLMTQWLERMASHDNAGDGNADNRRQSTLRQWAMQRITHLHDRLKQANRHAMDAQSLHEVRIQAKRIRYGIDALRGVLPSRMARKWHRQALDLQRGIGTDRDIDMAIELLGQIEAPVDIVALLRGFAAGRRSH